MEIKSMLITVMMGIMLTACQSTERQNTEQQIENVPAGITSTEGLDSYWECPMKCEGKRFASAGNCPICGMALQEMKTIPAPAPADTGQGHEHHEGNNYP